MTSNWYDLNADGRRLANLIKQMHGTMSTLDLADNDQQALWFAYLDRLLKATNSKVAIAETVLNVKGFLTLARKQHGPLPTEGVLQVS